MLITLSINLRLFRSGTDRISLLILLLFFLLLGRPSSKSLMFRRFQSDRDAILKNCCLCKYASIDGVGILI